MLSITVKTMDSQSRQCEVEESTTIGDFKEKIHQQVNIPRDRQRLIYQGRVLQDDFVLTSEHNEKVFHLVQRIPVDTTTVASASSSTTVTSSAAQTNSTSSSTGSNVFNPAQLSQMIFQQAMGGLGNLMNGSSIRGNMGVNPNNPLEHLMNFQIDVNGNQVNSRPPQSAGATATPSTHTQNQRPSTHHRHSIPRQQLVMVERIFVQLNAVLEQLERNSAPTNQGSTQENTGTDVDQSGEVFANENFEDLEEELNVMDTNEGSSTAEPASTTNTTSTQTQAAQSSSNTTTTSDRVPTCQTHPSLGELGRFFSQMLEAQGRLEPFINETIHFLNTDPSFSSTQSPEYQATSRMLSHTLQAQQMLAEIQRLLSRVVIPLGRTPPRAMLVPVTPDGMHHHQHSRNAGRRMNPEPQSGPPPAFGQQRPNFPRFSFGIPPGTGGGQPRVVPVAHGVQMRLRFPQQPGRTATSSSNPISSTTASSASSGPSVPNAPRQAESGGTSDLRTTHFNVAPPTYTVQVNATIEPRVHINVGTGPVGGSSTNEAPPNFARNAANGQQTADSGSRPQGQNNAGANPPGNAQQGTGVLPNLPNIPGVPQDVFSNIFQSVARSAQQQLFGNQQQQTPNASVIVVQGPPGGPNQINEDVSNILGQTVYNAVYNELSRSNQPSTLSSTTVPNVHFVSSSSRLSPTTSVTNTVSSSGSTTATALSPSSSSTDPASMETCPPASSSASLKEDIGDKDEDVAGNSAKTSSDAKPNSSAVDLVSGGSFGSLPASGNDPETTGLLASSSPSDIAQMMDIIRNEVPRPQTTEARSSQSETLSDEELSVIFNRVISDVAGESTTFTSQPANQFARQLGFALPERSGDNSMASRIFFEMGEELTAAEILGICQHDPIPLNRVRGRLQRLISHEYFSGVPPTSVPQIETVAHVLSEMLRNFVTEFFVGARVIPDVDIVESNLSLLRHSLKKVIEIIFLTDDSTFALAMSKHLKYVIALWTGLNENLLRGGRRQLVKLFKNFKPLHSKSSGAIMLIIEQVYSQSAHGGEPFAAFLNYLVGLSTISQDQIDQFVLSEAPQKVESDPGSPETEEDEKFEDAMETSPNRPLPSTSGTSSTAGSSRGPAPSAASTEAKDGSGDNWKKEVPAEWVDTIVADAEKQKKMDPQLPYSDAYVVGMPASKRRKVVS